MHENGWFAVGISAKKIYLMTQERKQNILNQQFTVSRPNEVWVSDITYFRYNDFSYYICVILDLYARRVVAHKISLKNSKLK
jgi:transposase InsO family protein